MIQKQTARTLAVLMLLLIPIAGCEEDEEARQIAREAADRQAQQNTVMAELNKEVASGAKRLIEADALARKEIVGVHRELQAERTRLDAGWGSLEQERKQVAAQRRTESMLVPVTTLVGGVLLVALVLGFCWYALVANSRGDAADAQLNELLISEILPDEPPLLTSGQRPPALLGQSNEQSAD